MRRPRRSATLPCRRTRASRTARARARTSGRTGREAAREPRSPRSRLTPRSRPRRHLPTGSPRGTARTRSTRRRERSPGTAPRPRARRRASRGPTRTRTRPRGGAFESESARRRSRRAGGGTRSGGGRTRTARVGALSPAGATTRSRDLDGDGRWGARGAARRQRTNIFIFIFPTSPFCPLARDDRSIARGRRAAGEIRAGWHEGRRTRVGGRHVDRAVEGTAVDASRDEARTRVRGVASESPAFCRRRTRAGRGWKTRDLARFFQPSRVSALWRCEDEDERCFQTRRDYFARRHTILFIPARDETPSLVRLRPRSLQSSFRLATIVHRIINDRPSDRQLLPS
jgi:hypothetical protein